MYVSLHNRTAYSFGTALTMPVQLVALAHQYGMPAVALTDLNGLYATVEFHETCSDAGIKPIFGAELNLEDGHTLTLLAKTPKGYSHLCHLISRRQIQPLKVSEVSAKAQDLICLTGPAPLENGSPPAYSPMAYNGPAPCPSNECRRYPTADTGVGRYSSQRLWGAGLESLREAFAGRLYVELAIHRAEDVPVARRRAQWADELGIPVVATCASRCPRRDQALLLRALASIGTLTLLDAPHPDKPEGCWHLRTPAEMAHLFRRRPDALANTWRIAEQCAVAFDMTRNRFPAFVSPDGRSAAEHLRALGIAGCRRRYVEQPQQKGIGGRRPTLAEALERLERELNIINQVHYAEYFLVFHEIVEYCRSQGIATLARGSAADSLVCYALGVSHACPFRFELPFDRFLNVERAKFSKMADIDLDLPWDRRDQVIDWVFERWGRDRVAMIGSPNTFHARAAVAELGKVYGLPPHEVHRVTKRLPRSAAQDLPGYLVDSPEARALPFDEEPYRTILGMAMELEGLPRHWSLHPCGLVVSPESLSGLMPVQPSAKGPLVAQHDMDAIERLGFIKIDLLGQAGLSVLRDAVAEIDRTEGVRVDLERDVDYSEPATWDLIARGQARGVHHIESPAMTSLIQQCNCRDIDTLTAMVAIIRPGAANQGKKDMFARRHMGREPPTYAHPVLVPILERTHGMMVFEEHILQIATEFAGMNLGQADVLRRALNKENIRMIWDMKRMFEAGARALGRAEGEIAEVWQLVEGFRGFMFNKAHSAEYSVEAFQGAWLKRRWPAHYLAAILSNYRGFYAHSPTLPQILYVMEALRHGVRFRWPCVNRSRLRFSVEETAGPPRETFIRIPIAHINGLAEGFLLRYRAERERSAFDSLEDFVRRCQPGEAEALSLLDAGALDVFGKSRPELFWRLRRLLKTAPAGGANLWAARLDGETIEPPIGLTRPDARQKARRETELLGFPVTLDPLTYLGSDDQGGPIDWSKYTPVAELMGHLGRRVRVCGLMVADRITGQAGGLMKFVTLADRTGFVETILFPDAYRRFGHLTVAHSILAATGVVEPFETGTGFTLRVQRVETCSTEKQGQTLGASRCP